MIDQTDINNLDLVSLADYNIKSINFYFEKHEQYNISLQELEEINIIDNICRANKSVALALVSINQELFTLWYEIYVKDAYRSQELYDLVYKKRIELHGKENVDKIFKPVRAIHSTGNAIDVTLIDINSWKEVIMRNDYNENGTKKTHEEIIKSFYGDVFQDSNIPEEIEFHNKRMLLKDIMIKYWFIGIDHEYRHFEYIVSK